MLPGLHTKERPTVRAWSDIKRELLYIRTIQVGRTLCRPARGRLQTSTWQHPSKSKINTAAAAVAKIPDDHPAAERVRPSPLDGLAMNSPLSSPTPSPLSPLVPDDVASRKENISTSHHWGHRFLCNYLPPSFNDPSGNTRPAYLFPIFLLINIATMTDRTIIAGANKEFSAFISSAPDSPQFVKDNPDAGIGLLQGWQF